MSQSISEWFEEQVLEHFSHGETDMPEIGRKIAAEMPSRKLREFAEWTGPHMVLDVNRRLSTRSGTEQREASKAGLERRQQAHGLYRLTQTDGTSVIADEATPAQLRDHADLLEAHARATEARAKFWREEADYLDASDFDTYGELLAAREEMVDA